MEKRGISIDYKKLEELLGVPVVPTSAIKGKGISELTEQIVRQSERERSLRRSNTEERWSRG